MLGKVGAGEGPKADPELDDTMRYQLKAVLQFLQEKELIETLVALECETGLKYVDGDLPVAGVLQSSLDMYGRLGSDMKEEASDAKVTEEALQALSDGVCCTGSCETIPGVAPFSANVTAVKWAASVGEHLALVATADRKLRLLYPEGVLEYTDLASPPLALDAFEQDVLVTTMGGEAHVLRISTSECSGFELRQLQSFKDHQKQVACGRFAPGGANFVTISRDHSANVYVRDAKNSDFTLLGTWKLAGEVTACCWLDASTLILAARDDHELHYLDVAADGLKESMRVNLNALGDRVVSFAVLALSVSPNGSMVAACTDRSRVIVLQARSSRQLRNLYGASVNEYDLPSVCFSLDSCFLYVSSSLPQPREEVKVLCGQLAIFELRSARLVLQLPCHEKAVRCFDRHPFTEMLVTGSFDKTVKFWS
mmetsp:Transcript_71269/g.157343  ORF Transcript_71269/g.157343 Transcript_71269/m.157343 type:complete len:425 (-) Transcript_71269:124-1398(-)